MVSFLFHSKGNAPCVNQKSIIQITRSKGAFGENEGRGNKCRDLGVWGCPGSIVADGVGPGLGCEAVAWPAPARPESGRGTKLPCCSPCSPPWALLRAAPIGRADSCPLSLAHGLSTLPETRSVSELSRFPR